MQPGLFAVNLRGTLDQISPRQQLLGSIISKMLCKVILDIFRVGGKRGYLKKKKKGYSHKGLSHYPSSYAR